MLSTIVCAVLIAAPQHAPETTAESSDTFDAFEFCFNPGAAEVVPNFALLQDDTASEPFGLAGSTYWLVNVAASTDFADDHLARAGLGISYFLADDFSIDFELNVGHFWQIGEDAFGANFNILLRWHFWGADDRSWTVYLDGGAGMLLTSDDVPDTGSSFNFTPQFGVGASFDLGDDLRLYVGGRWFHVSNARLYDNNPGQDYGMAYAMIGWPF